MGDSQSKPGYKTHPSLPISYRTSDKLPIGIQENWRQVYLDVTARWGTTFYHDVTRASSEAWKHAHTLKVQVFAAQERQGAVVGRLYKGALRMACQGTADFPCCQRSCSACTEDVGEYRAGRLFVGHENTACPIVPGQATRWGMFRGVPSPEVPHLPHPLSRHSSFADSCIQLNI